LGINVGIDLGTTYSAVAFWDDSTNQVKVLENSDNQICTPSVVHIQNGKIKIGNEAKFLQGQGDLATAAFYKSMMGERGYTLYLDGREYSPEELSGLYLRELISDIQKHNNIQIDGAVITCPAYFNEAQRLATQNAGVKAGLKVLKIINEPTAAIIAYGLTGSSKKNVMVYDLGGGTFDVTIAEIDGTNVKVLTTNGNHQLGGKNWDAVIADELCQRFFDEFNVNIEDNQEDFYQLKVSCEDIKKSLSNITAKTATVQSGGYTGRYEITRQFFDEATYSLLNETMLLIGKCFSEIGGGFSWESLDEVVLVGGSTRMPQVKEYIRREYGKDPVTKNINVDTIVAVGAAMQAKLCIDNRLVISGPQSSNAERPRLVITGDSVQDITSHSLGMLALATDEISFVNSIIIKKNSQLNQRFDREYIFAGKTMDVYVLQGESGNPRECALLYKYCVHFPTTSKTRFNIHYIYNKDGIVEVSAETTDGTSLNVVKSTVDESIDEVINRLLREREEQKKRNSQAEIMFIVDTSYSMEGEPIKLAKQAAEDFVKQLDLERFSISIVNFAETCRLECQNEKRQQKITRAIHALAVETCGAGTSATPLRAYGHRFHSKEINRIIVVLTDGAWDNQISEIRAAEQLKTDGITIYAIGFGGADEVFLNKIATEKGAKKIDLAKLSQTFIELASSIAVESSS